MDAMEQMALDLELAQRKRLADSGARHSLAEEEDFWDQDEMVIFRTIRTFREQSRSLNPERPVVEERTDMAKTRKEIRAEAERRVMDMRVKGMSNVAIGRALGMPESTVRRIIKKAKGDI